MKIFLGMIETVIIAGLIYLLIVNYQAQTISGVSIGIEGYTNLVFSTLFVITGCFIAGWLAGVTFGIFPALKYKQQINAYAKRSEKLSQQKEIDADDKEALKRKIASLEIALEKALNSK